MKKFIYIILAAAAMMFFAGEANAQMGKRYFVGGGWQFNGTIANEYVQTAQGYGAYLEGGYYVTPKFAVGGFASFGTNNKYIPKQTYQLENNAAITTDLDRSIYQVPFGVMTRIRFMRGEFQPYLQPSSRILGRLQRYLVANIRMATTSTMEISEDGTATFTLMRRT